MRSSAEVEEDLGLFLSAIPEDAWTELDEARAGSP
jgi:hypothetical protein